MSSTGLRCLHRIESKKTAIRKLTSTRSDVNRIQRRGEFRLRKNAGSERRLLRIDESASAEEGGLRTNVGKKSRFLRQKPPAE